MTLSTLSSWTNYFSSNKDLNSSNHHLIRIRNSVGPSIPILNSFDEISKNQGVSFLSLDPSESQLQLFHHCTPIGGSWDSPSKHLVAILGFDSTAKPIQIVQKSIKDVKQKTYSFDDFATGLETQENFEALKTPNSVFLYKNIIPIPNLLTKTFMNLPSTEPYTVARAFFEAMHDYDSQLNDTVSPPTAQETLTVEPDLTTESDNDTTSKQDDTPDIPDTTSTSNSSPHPKFMTEFIHVIQFCHLCAKGKISPVLYTLTTSSAVQSWFSSVSPTFRIEKKVITKRTSSTDDNDLSSDDEISSPDQKISKKDHYFISTMMKLHDTMDRNNLKQSREKDEREPGFNRLELHRKNLILNASASPPFDTQASHPTEFYNSFLSKKSQFKAKEMMTHHFHLNKVAVNPSTSFIANLWNSDFFWILPESPSGVSIFFCP